MSGRASHVGERHGHLTVAEEVGHDAHGNLLVRCVCDCGRETERRYNDLRPTSKCARWDHDKLGGRYGRLTVLDYDHSDASGQAWYRCRCDCGNETLAKSVELGNGDTRSCGCLRDESLAAYRASNQVDGTILSGLTSEPTVASTSGVRGVSRHASGLWQAYINLAGRRHSLGYYRTLEAAAEVRRRAERIVYDPVLRAHGADPTSDPTWRERAAAALRSLRDGADGTLTASEVAERVGRSPKAVINAIRSGRLEGRKVGNRWAVDPEDMRRWLDGPER